MRGHESGEIPEKCVMSIRPRLGVEVPELTARVARAANPAGTTAMQLRDRLDGLWADEDFAGWYPRDGRPGISPAQLATICVLQFLLDLSDRDAAEAVRCRIDFKYALGLELDDPVALYGSLGVSGRGTPPPATASAPWDSPRANCPDCRSVTALTSRTPPGTSATPSGPASRAPSASSPAATACATAATEASPKPTSSTY